MNDAQLDINGKLSAKRKWASKFLSLGYWMAVIYCVMWVIAFFFKLDLALFPMELWIGIVGFGSGQLISTIFEKAKINTINKTAPEKEEP